MVEDQAEAMRQAEIGVNKISEVVQSNAATAEEAAATSEELSSQSIVLDELIGQFILNAMKTRWQPSQYNVPVCSLVLQERLYASHAERGNLI